MNTTTVYDKNGQPYEADLVDGEEYRALKADFREQEKRIQKAHREAAQAIGEVNIKRELLARAAADLQAWKDSMMALEREWDAQHIAKLLGAKLGQSCRAVINERVPVLVAERAILIDALRAIANEDRGAGAGYSVTVARNALRRAETVNPPVR